MKPYKESDHGGLLSFRPMHLGDIDTICEIELEVFPTPWSASAFHNELVNNHFSRYIVMEYEGEVIGYGGMWTIMEDAHVTNIAIRPPFQGKRLGQRLLAEMQSAAIQLGASGMTLEVRESNAIAQRLYRKMGFRPTGVRKQYYSDNLEDAVIMWADLPISNEQPRTQVAEQPVKYKIGSREDHDNDE